ncbi:MAG: hypothetical protein M1833_005400 [Piccolia ochrophora]|nr:MAG: hypothetical protein M1833_005400 [Piccolia ochrophora]
MGRDEQKEEREVLDSIFPDEITDLSEWQYRISIQLDVPSVDEEEDPAPIMLLQVTYPEDYPDVAPSLELSAPPNAAPYEDLNVSEDRERLLEALEPIVEENIGMAMVFTLVSTLKDSAELLISERQQATRAIKEAQQAEAEEEENKKFHGSAVTRESFLQWRDDFQQEILELEQKKEAEKEAEDKKKRAPKEERRMTGRELWEKGLIGKIDEDEEESGAVDAISQLKVAN